MIMKQLAGDELDERFVEHRYRASRLSLLVGVGLLLAWFLYEHYANGVTHLEILAIMAGMALTKLGAMAYYRLTA